MARDLDDMCAYKTDVKVLIRHKTVGCLYYACMIAILGGYVIGYEYVIKGGWGAMVDFTGSLRATGKSSSVLAPIDSLHYCTQAQPGKAPVPAVRMPCMSSDDEVTMRPTSLGVLVGTRLSTVFQESNTSCGVLEYGCSRWVQRERVDAFIGDVEGATVLVQHAVAPSFAQKIKKEAVDTFHNRSDPKSIEATGLIEPTARMQCLLASALLLCCRCSD